MASLGSITSLGVGSGFELQQMLEDFRSIDEQPIDAMREDITDIKDRLAKYDEVKAMLISVKSSALTLSLESNFLERTVSSSDEEIATATVIPGTTLTSNSIEITRLATKSSWQTVGVAGADTSTYIPTIQESTTGFENTDFSEAVSEDAAITITYGPVDSPQTLSVDLASGMTLDQVVEAINTDTGNDDGAGSTYVTASTFQGEDEKYYLRIASTAGGSTETNRVMITEQPEDLQFEAPEVTFTYTLGDGDAVEVSVEADTTFNDLAELINSDAANSGVTAKVVNDGGDTNPYHLVLTADNTGEDNRITISGIPMTEVQGADGASLNSEISVDGILIQRQTNTNIDDIIQGVSLTLEKEGDVTITTGNDDELIKTKIMDLVESYNEFVQEVRTNSVYDEETEDWGILGSSYTIKSLPSELNGIMSTIIKTSGDIDSLFDMGMEINRDGTITIDEEELDTALTSNRENVVEFFITDEDTGRLGMGDILNEKLRNLTNATGVIATETDFANDQVDRLEEDIESATERLDRRYDILARQFVELDMYIGQMNAQASYLTSMFDSYDSSQQKS